MNDEINKHDDNQDDKHGFEKLRAVRLEKMDKLRESGRNPYPYRFEVTHKTAFIREHEQGLFAGETVVASLQQTQPAFLDLRARTEAAAAGLRSLSAKSPAASSGTVATRVPRIRRLQRLKTIRRNQPGNAATSRNFARSRYASIKASCAASSAR